MSHFEFSDVPVAASLASVAGGASRPADADPAQTFRAIAAIDRAGPSDVTIFLDGDDPDDLAASRAGACFIAQKYAAFVPAHMIPLVAEEPLEALRRALTILYPSDASTGRVFGRQGIDPTAMVHAEALLERDVTIEPGAVIGPRVEIGSGTTVGANTVIGAGVRIGRGCDVNAQAGIFAALIGDRVVIQAGARIGIDPIEGPSLGRVIVQNDVKIGANAVIERGRLGDTMIGEGAKVGMLAVIAADTLIDRERTHGMR